MADYVKISPLTRLEGHLGITARVSDETPYYVSSAYSHGEMFRGLEKILINRDPRDAPVITSRTCGVCHFIHRHTSLRNIETAAGFVFPFAQAMDASYGTGPSGNAINSGPGSLTNRWHGNGRQITDSGSSDLGGDKMPLAAQFARNIVHAVTFIYSHAAHTIALAAPDYKGWIDEFVQRYVDGRLSGTVWEEKADAAAVTYKASDLKDNDGSFFDNFYKEAVVAQRILHEILGFLGGKVPHQQSAIPGGFSRSFKGQYGADGDFDAIATLASKLIGHGGSTPDTAGTKGTDYFPLIDVFNDAIGTGVADTILDTKSTLATSADDGWIVKRVGLFTLALAYACSNGADSGSEGDTQTKAVLWGRGSDNFVSAGTFDIVHIPGTDPANWSITGDQYFRAGVKLSDNTWYGLDPTTGTPRSGDWMTIYEDITSGKYPEPDDITGRPVCGGYPGDSETHPATYTHGLNDRYTYTWYKATRAYDGEKTFTVESGPFARLVVNGCDPDLNLTTSSDLGFREYLYDALANLPSYGWKSTTANRLLGRVQDILLLVDMLFGTDYSGENKSGDYLDEIDSGGSWLTRLHRALSAVDPEPIPSGYLVADADWENFEGEGAAFWDAPRGITCHFSKVENGLLTQYQHIAGTTWNGNGRDAWGNPGPFEWSLMGVTKKDKEYSLYTDPHDDIETGDLGSGKVVIELKDADGNDLTSEKPVVERTLKIKYKLAGTEYEGHDKPKTGVDENEGQIVGVGLKSTSKVVYDGTDAGKVVLEFTYDYRYPDYSHVSDIEVVRFCYVANIDPDKLPVPANDVWADSTGTTDAYNWGLDAQDGTNDGKPNPINVLRTIRSYDPCLACSIHVVDKEGREGKYEAVPMAGWDPK